VSDDDDRYEDEELDEGNDFDDDPDLTHADGCCLGAACLNPHPYHLAYECFDLEMAEMAEAEEGAWA